MRTACAPTTANGGRPEAEWGTRYPPTAQAWRKAWQHVILFLSLPDELRRAVYTTNTIEGLHRQVRKAIKTRGHFPDEQAAERRRISLGVLRPVSDAGSFSSSASRPPLASAAPGAA